MKRAADALELLNVGGVSMSATKTAQTREQILEQAVDRADAKFKEITKDRFWFERPMLTEIVAAALDVQPQSDGEPREAALDRLLSQIKGASLEWKKQAIERAGGI